jgi:hypothetical protein
LIGHAVVVPVELLRAERHAPHEKVGIVGRILLTHRKFGLLPHAHPHAALFFEDGQEGRGEATDRGFPAIIGLSNGDAVRDYG